MPQDIQKKIKKAKIKTYLAKDFDSFKADLHRFARIYFPDKIQDFSEASLGGLLLEMAAYVGDTMSFYLDHQFNELFPATAVETENILRHLRAAGVPIETAAPATVTVDFFVTVPARRDPVSGVTRADANALPVIKKDTALSSTAGILFYLTEDLDFSLTDRMGTLKATQEVFTVISNQPKSFRLSLPGICVSGKLKVESFKIADQHVPFREIALSQPNVSSILDVIDTDSNRYYQVDSLTQDVVFIETDISENFGNEKVYDLAIIPAPRRYLKIVNPSSRLTTIRFGSGNADTMADDIIPDPSELALPLYGKRSFSKFAIDPNSLLKTNTLGLSPLNTTLTVSYLYGGGLSHNVAAGAINGINTLYMQFPRRPSGTIIEAVRGSLFAVNTAPAGGGMPAPTLNELKEKIPAMRQMQSRIVTAQDLIARVYTLPAKFGRAFRCAVSPNMNNPLSTTMYVISKDTNGNLALSPDALKKNLRNYLNEFRLVSDALDIVDARVINFGVEFNIITTSNVNDVLVIQQITRRLAEILNINNFQINQPINIGNIVNMIINVIGVLSLVDMPRVFTRTGIVENRQYNDSTFDPATNTIKGMVVPPLGGLFELKFSAFDIIGNVT